MDFSGNQPHGFAKFVMDHGRYWTPQARPAEFAKGEDRQCFANSQHEAVMAKWRKEKLWYCEGYALSGELDKLGAGFPIHHGWLVDDEGRVIDVTWRQPGTSTYFGVPFKTAYVTKMANTYKMWNSLIDHHMSDWALVRGETPLDEAVLNWEKRNG